MTGMFLLSVALLGISQQAAPIQQSTSGWCSPAIANVSGNVTVTCIGVDPRALKELNWQLSRKKLQIKELVHEANELT